MRYKRGSEREILSSPFARCLFVQIRVYPRESAANSDSFAPLVVRQLADSHATVGGDRTNGRTT